MITSKIYWCNFPELSPYVREHYYWISL